jgi:hypothetical protein
MPEVVDEGERPDVVDDGERPDVGDEGERPDVGDDGERPDVVEDGGGEPKLVQCGLVAADILDDGLARRGTCDDRLPTDRVVDLGKGI